MAGDPRQCQHCGERVRLTSDAIMLHLRHCAGRERPDPLRAAVAAYLAALDGERHHAAVHKVSENVRRLAYEEYRECALSESDWAAVREKHRATHERAKAAEMTRESAERELRRAAGAEGGRDGT